MPLDLRLCNLEVLVCPLVAYQLHDMPLYLLSCFHVVMLASQIFFSSPLFDRLFLLAIANVSLEVMLGFDAFHLRIVVAEQGMHMQVSTWHYTDKELA